MKRHMTADVLVVGAGIIGASIAWRLAQSGAAVLLADAGGMGGEASSAGAGMLAPGGEVTGPGVASELAIEGRRLYSGYVRELEQEAGGQIDYRECGGLELALDAAELEALRARGRLQWEMGIRSEDVAPPEGWAGARFYPGDAIVDPRDVMDCLRVACVRRGVTVRENYAVRRLGWASRRVEADTVTGSVTCEAAVLAAGAWSSGVGVEPALGLPAAFPVRGHLTSYRMEPGTLVPILRHGHTYLLQRSSGELVAGTTQEKVGLNRSIDPAAVESIRSRASQLLPALRDRRPERVWTGFRPGAAAVPVVGRAGESPIWSAYGHFRNGILMAPSTAAQVAAEIIASLGRG